MDVVLRTVSNPGPCSATIPLEEVVNLKKVIGWLVIAFVVFYIIQAPDSSAELVRRAGTALGDAASSLAQFLGNLT